MLGDGEMPVTLATPAEMRAARFEVLVTELYLLLRRSDPQLSEQMLLERAEYLAASRLAGGDMLWSVIGSRMPQQSVREDYRHTG
jgi:hypothetical protein